MGGGERNEDGQLQIKVTSVQSARREVCVTDGVAATLSDGGQMAALVRSHGKRKAGAADRGGGAHTPTCSHLSTHTPTHHLAERTPHMARSAQLLALT